MVLNWNLKYWCEFMVFKMDGQPHKHNCVCLAVVIYVNIHNLHYLQVPYVQIYVLKFIYNPKINHYSAFPVIFPGYL